MRRLILLLIITLFLFGCTYVKMGDYRYISIFSAPSLEYKKTTDTVKIMYKRNSDTAANIIMGLADVAKDMK